MRIVVYYRNRKDPIGFLRVNSLGKNEFKISQIPVIEPVYNQKVSFSALTWNGKEYIGYTDGSWFQSPSGYVFTVHDPLTLKVLRNYPAPDQLGGIAWDGENYWAATRKNTEDASEPAYLYKLNPDFKEIARYDPPAVGCQGLAWDGSKLWDVDVFTNSIYLLDTQKDPPEGTHTYRTRFTYLSGIAFDGSHIWVAEYGDNQIHRLNRTLRMAWLRGNVEVADADQASTFIESKKQELVIGKSIEDYVRMLQTDHFHRSEAVDALVAMGEEQKAIEVLHEMLASQDRSTFRSARSELEKLGAPIPEDRSENFQRGELPVDNIEFIDFKIRIKENGLYGWWNIHFGEELFSGISNTDQNTEMSFPTFAKYTINVEGGTLPKPLRIEYEATSGSTFAKPKCSPPISVPANIVQTSLFTFNI